MEITIISGIDPYTPKPGGTRSYVMSLIQFLCEHGIKTTLIGVSSNKKEVPTEYLFTFIPVTRGQNLSSYKFLFSLFLKTPFLNIPKSSIIHTQRPDDMLPFVLFYKNNPKICTLHGTPLNAIYFKKGPVIGKIYELIEKFVLKRMDTVIAVDGEAKKFYTQMYPQIKDKIMVIPVGINTKLFKPANRHENRKKYHLNENEKIILYVGRLNVEKGLDLLLKSFKEVKKEVEDCKLVLVGEGKDRDNLENLAKNIELKDIIFMGALERDKIPEIINCADVFALCSLYEGMPTVVLEALACGVPVVSTNVGDVHKVVRNDKTGYIVEKRTKEEMSDKLIKALSNSGRFEANCIGAVQEYSWDRIAKRITGVYDELLEKN
jgi:glycosyltransferase involved in cell wall biosynthesis